MNWVNELYVIVLQPDVNKTIHQVNTQEFNLSLNDEQVAGLLLMAYNVFGIKWKNKLRVRLITTVSTTQNSYNNKDVYPEYTPELFLSLYSVTKSRKLLPYDEGYWYQYINQLALSDTSKGYIPNEIKYPYTCRFKNTHEYTIYQFDSTDFIQGALSLCQWFHLDPNQYMDNVHIGNESLTLF